MNEAILYTSEKHDNISNISYNDLKYIHTEKVVNSYNEVHTYSIVITLHACGLWNMPPHRPSVGSYSCISGCEYFEVWSMP